MLNVRTKIVQASTLNSNNDVFLKMGKDKKVDPEINSKLIADWLKLIETKGFYCVTNRDSSKTNINKNANKTLKLDSTVVRVFDPYMFISSTDIKHIDGKVNPSTDMPIGKATVTLFSGDEIFGTFKNGKRFGKSSICGENLEKFGIICVRGNCDQNGILTGPGQSIISPNCWNGQRSPVILNGSFYHGCLEGPVYGTNQETGDLVFVGRYANGIPFGKCWLMKEGQGWLHGKVNSKGRFTGDHILYLYPDKLTCLIGTFQDEKMVSAYASSISSISIESHSQIMNLKVVKIKKKGIPLTYSPSSRHSMPCDWKVADCYESRTVVCKTSNISEAGEGLFALRNVPEMTIISYYNGLCIQSGDIYNNQDSTDYQIYIDWKNIKNSAFIDIPAKCTNTANYCASLGHKANHSYQPNCQFTIADHPIFGIIPALKTMVTVSLGTELLVHYKYHMDYAPEWYLANWENIDHKNILTKNTTK